MNNHFAPQPEAKSPAPAVGILDRIEQLEFRLNHASNQFNHVTRKLDDVINHINQINTVIGPLFSFTQAITNVLERKQLVSNDEFDAEVKAIKDQKQKEEDDQTRIFVQDMVSKGTIITAETASPSSMIVLKIDTSVGDKTANSSNYHVQDLSDPNQTEESTRALFIGKKVNDTAVITVPNKVNPDQPTLISMTVLEIYELAQKNVQVETPTPPPAQTENSIPDANLPSNTETQT
jgi:hypothetical protein